MAYLGGKAKNSDHILSILNSPHFDNLDYLEPFVGYGHILRRVNNKKSYTVSDNNPLLINLLKCVQNKNIKYPTVTKEEFHELKKLYRKDGIIKFKTPFAAFTYAFNGIEFSGYVNKNGKRVYPRERKNYYDSLRQNKIFMKSNIYLKDYSTWNPKTTLIYCDPPYRGTSSYVTSMSFDHDKFWNIIRKWSKNNYVFVSEYSAPSDFKVISSSKKHSTVAGKGSGDIRNENLYVYKYGMIVI